MAEEGLGNKARKGVFWDFLSSFLSQISTLIVTIILARILSPEEFGIVGMAMVFISLSHVFVDVGLTEGIIQQTQVSNAELSSIFYLNVFLSLIISILIFISSGIIGYFYNESQVGTVVSYLSGIPVIAALGKVHGTILMKEMNFRFLAIRSILATSVSGILGVIAASYGAGVNALVLQQITLVAMTTLLLWFGSGWRPGLSFSLTKVKRILGFSTYVFFDQVLRQVFLKIDTIFIGKVFSASTLGFYTRAESLNAQVSRYTSSTLRRVIFPAFSAVKSNNQEFEHLFVKAWRISSVVGVLSSGILYLLSEEIIIGLLGEKWEPSIVIFQILVFRLLLTPFGALLGRAILAKGYSKLKFRISQVQRLLLLMPLIVGYFYNITVFTLALVLFYFIGMVFNAYVVCNKLEISFMWLTKIFLKPLLPLVIFVVISNYYIQYVSSFYMAILFVASSILYLYLLKDEGLKYVFFELKKSFYKN